MKRLALLLISAALLTGCVTIRLTPSNRPPQETPKQTDQAPPQETPEQRQENPKQNQGTQDTNQQTPKQSQTTPNQNRETPDEKTSNRDQQTSTPNTPDTSNPTPAEQLQAAAQEAIRALRDKQMDRLAALVHPRKGVRFSPHSMIYPGTDRLFTAEQVKTLLQDPTVYLWGFYPFDGGPIEMTFADYYNRFVYDMDYANAPKTAVDTLLVWESRWMNLYEIYPDGHFVEFHFPGTEERGYMNWRSLRLVFEEQNGQWYLVGIIHDEWGI